MFTSAQEVATGDRGDLAKETACQILRALGRPALSDMDITGGREVKRRHL